MSKSKMGFFKDKNVENKESFTMQQLLKDCKDHHSALKKQQQRVAEYCSEVSGKIKNYEQMEASYPGDSNVTAHLDFNREELKKSESTLLTLYKLLTQSEKRIHAMEEKHNSDTMPGSSSKGL